MKKLICLVVMMIATTSFAKMPNIVAVVNDYPITKYDLQSRKHMAITLNNIENLDSMSDKKLNNEILNILIDESLLEQFAKDNLPGNNQIDEAIFSIEKTNGMKRGEMKIYLQEKGVSFDSFRKQIRSELIKMNVVNELSGFVNISESEVDDQVINVENKFCKIDAWLFSSKGSTKNDLENMRDLRRKLTSCEMVTEKIYKRFSDGRKINCSLDELSDITKSIAIDTKAGEKSNIFKENGKFNLMLMCKKDIMISGEHLKKVRLFISNKKMSKKAMQFFKNLKSKASIEILLNK